MKASTTSSCSQGTVLKGINIIKGGQDPVALADEEYPAWLWTLTAPKKTEWTPEEQLSRKYLRMRSEQLIKMNALRGNK